MNAHFFLFIHKQIVLQVNWVYWFTFSVTVFYSWSQQVERIAEQSRAITAFNDKLLFIKFNKKFQFKSIFGRLECIQRHYGCV